MRPLPVLILLAATIAALPGARSFGQVALDTTFTYQGQLKRGAVPVNEVCDFKFVLFDALSGGNSVGPTEWALGLPVTNGLFSVQLNFGAGAFPGDQRFLRVAVQCPGDQALTILSPRFALTAVPYALHALNGGGSLWSATGSDVYYDVGNVGVGATAPAHALHVVSDGERAIFGDNTAT